MKNSDYQQNINEHVNESKQSVGNINSFIVELVVSLYDEERRELASMATKLVLMNLTKKLVKGELSGDQQEFLDSISKGDSLPEIIESYYSIKDSEERFRTIIKSKLERITSVSADLLLTNPNFEKYIKVYNSNVKDLGPGVEILDFMSLVITKEEQNSLIEKLNADEEIPTVVRHWLEGERKIINSLVD